MGSVIPRKINHCLLIDKEELESLCNFIAENYKNISITAYCIDGTRLERDKISEILSFENPRYRKIKSISVQAKNDFAERVSIDIQTSSLTSGFYPSAEITVNSELDAQALYISQEIVKRFGEMKPWYDILGRLSLIKVLSFIGIVMSVFTAFGQTLGLLPFTQSTKTTSFFEIVNVIIIISVIYVVTVYPLSWIQELIFPKVFFAIGKQIKTLENIGKFRTFIFGGVIFAIGLGVLINLISAALIGK